MAFRRWKSKIREYDEITNLSPIVRRYFVIGSFDGALTILGVILGAFAVGASEAHKALVISASIGAGVALAVSSTVGAYEAERVEKKLDQFSLESAMLAEMSERHMEAFRFAAWISAIVHGISPLMAALIPVLPFLFLPFYQATISSILVTLAVLFVIGSYLGSLAKERFFITGLRFVAAGLGTAAILYFLGVHP